jgi:hypothetical protein
MISSPVSRKVFKRVMRSVWSQQRMKKTQKLILMIVVDKKSWFEKDGNR